MSEPSPAPSAGSSSAPAVRTSGRSRHKSQRVLQSEETSRALARAKAAQEAGEAAPAPKAKAGPARKSARKGKAKAAEEVYCICKSRKPGAMIECLECQDWFHFDCIDLSPDEADLILEYRCKDCEAITGRKTSRKYDLEVISPSSQPGSASPERKGVKRGKKGRKPQPDLVVDDETEEASSESSDSGSEAAFSDASAAPRRPVSKRRKVSGTPTNLIEQSRRASLKKKVDMDEGPLPPARQYCCDSLVKLARDTFGSDMSEENVLAFGEQAEAAMYAASREFVNGKPIAGSKYKTRFAMLNSAMKRGLRASLRTALLDKSITPAQFGTFTSADLASDSQLEEIQKVQRASLQQSVKEQPISLAIRVGRDGYEEVGVVDKAQEERDEDIAVGDDSVPMAEPEPSNSTIEQLDVSDALNNVAVSQAAEAAAEAAQARPELDPSPRKSSFTVPPPPRRPNTFALTSAWGSSRSGEDQLDESGSNGYNPLQALADESALDSGVFGADEVDADADKVFDEYLLAPEPEVEPEPVRLSPYEEFQSKPVVWSGKIDIRDVAEVQPRVEARLLQPLAPPLPAAAWSKIIPRTCFALTGRVPVPGADKFLNESFLKPATELFAVAFSLPQDATQEEVEGLEKHVVFHINKGRYGYYLPFGEKNKKHPELIGEWYFIPLRPSDATPEITELIDGCQIPSERPHVMYIAIAVAPKTALAAARGQPLPSAAPVTSTTPPMPAPPSAVPSKTDLQALMAQLNPAALASVMKVPAPAASPGPPTPVYSPMPPFAPTIPVAAGASSPYAQPGWQGHPQHRLGQSPLSYPSPQGQDPTGHRRQDSRQEWDRRRGSDQRRG